MKAGRRCCSRRSRRPATRSIGARRCAERRRPRLPAGAQAAEREDEHKSQRGEHPEHGLVEVEPVLEMLEHRGPPPRASPTYGRGRRRSIEISSQPRFLPRCVAAATGAGGGAPVSAGGAAGTECCGAEADRQKPVSANRQISMSRCAAAWPRPTRGGGLAESGEQQRRCPCCGGAACASATQMYSTCYRYRTISAPASASEGNQGEDHSRTIARAAAVAPDRVASMRGQSTSANLDRFAQPDRPDFPGNWARQNALALGGIVNRRRHAVAECGERFRQPRNLALLTRIEKAPRLLVVDFQQSREVCGGDALFFDRSVQRDFERCCRV